MLVVQDQVWGRVTTNRNAGKATRYYMDEFHLLLKEEQTASYSIEIWKRFRKWGGIPTGITQNVKDLLASREIENIFENSDFVYMLNQSGSMSVKLFRHTGYESILEGEVTETGGAFVMKRKISSLKNFFRFGRRKRGEYQNKNVKQDTVIKLEEAPVLNKDINKK